MRRKDRYTRAWRTEWTQQSCRLYVLLTQRACSMREEKKGGQKNGLSSAPAENAAHVRESQWGGGGRQWSRETIAIHTPGTWGKKQRVGVCTSRGQNVSTATLDGLQHSFIITVSSSKLELFRCVCTIQIVLLALRRFVAVISWLDSAARANLKRAETLSNARTSENPHF